MLQYPVSKAVSKTLKQGARIMKPGILATLASLALSATLTTQVWHRQQL